MEKYNRNEELAQFLTISQSDSPSYSVRTHENASAADLTLAFAKDFNTAGERCTAKAAGDRLVQIPYGKDGFSIQEAEAAVLSAIIRNGLTNKPIVINVAGNGIYTLKDNRELPEDAQKKADKYVKDVLSAIIADGVPVKGIRSGGQTGMDLAGARAGLALCLPTEVHYPKGFRTRGADGVDEQHTPSEIRDIIYNGLEEILAYDISLQGKVTLTCLQPFTISIKYLPEPLNHIKDEGIVFQNPAEAISYLQLRLTEIIEPDSLHLSSRQENEDNLKFAMNNPGEGAPIAMSLAQDKVWESISEDVMKSVYIDSFTQNGDSLSTLLKTGVAELVNLTGSEDMLMQIRSELRASIDRQKTGDWCKVSKAIETEAPELEEGYNFMNRRGDLFCEGEWFASTKEYVNGLVDVVTMDGIKGSAYLENPSEGKELKEKIEEARKAAKEESLDERVHFRRGI